MIKNSTDKKKYKITNWRDYKMSLKARGALIFWFSDDSDRGEGIRKIRP